MKRATCLAVAAITAFVANLAIAEEHKGQTPPSGDAKPTETKHMGEHHGMMQEQMMKTDTDRDGMISKSEWQTKGDSMFKEIDSSGDGKISRDEMKAHHEAKKAEWKKRREERMERREEVKEKIDALKSKKAEKPPAESKH